MDQALWANQGGRGPVRLTPQVEDPKAEGRKAERQKAEGRRQKAEGRRQKAFPRWMGKAF